MKKRLNKLISMKCLCIGILLCCMVTGGQAVPAFSIIDQRFDVELSLSNATLKNVVNSLKRQTDIVFSYDTSLESLRVNNVSVKVKGEAVDVLLEQVFRGTGINFTIDEQIVYLYWEGDKTTSKNYSTQQDVKKITGVVKDVFGEPIVGANVIVKGSMSGVITGIDGCFWCEVPQNAILVISYVGYLSQEIPVAGKHTLNIILMEDTQKLEEVVVVGYGNMARKDVTSSISTVRAEDLNVGVFSSPAQLLQGKVPGLTITQSSDPTATPSITLRGASTLRTGAAMEPYYVVDGVPGVSLSMVAPDDIASIDVLRDASATAIYGSKAANGVIIVTTKKGKSGQATVSYHGYVAIDKVGKNLEMMGAEEYRSYVANNGFSLDPQDDFDCNTDWQKEVQRVGISTNHNITINGGTEKTVYNASLNFLNNEGVIKGTDMKRYIGRGFVETKTLNDRLTLSFNVNASVTEQNTVPAESDGVSVYDAMNYFLPISPVKNEDGSWFERSSRSQYYNPLSLINENIDYTKSKRIQATAKASVIILPGVTYDVSLSYQNEQLNQNKYYSTKSLLEKDGRASRSSVENEKKILEMYFNYNKIFADVHKLSATLGYSWEENNDNNGFRATTAGFYSDDLLYYNLAMGNRVVDGEDGFGNYFLSTLRMISFFGRVNYSFASKYLFQATVRRDGSSAFGKNNQWATFPSASVAWRASEESFIKDWNVFDDLKFRIGYGVSGNSLGFDAFTAVQRYGATGWYTNAANEDVHTLGPIANANPDLKWEKTDMLNVGVDFSFFKNRLGGTIEYYNKNTKDLIHNYRVSTTQYLYNTLTANVGEINNKGIEVTLNAVPVQTKDITWSTDITLSHNKNTVKSISNGEFSVNYIEVGYLQGRGQSQIYNQRIMEGHPIGQFYTWEWKGYNEAGVSVFNDYDSEGNLIGVTDTPTREDQHCTGSAQPKLNFSWNNTLKYKNFTLTLYFQGLLGNKILNGTAAQYSNIGLNAGNYNMLKSVIETEKVTDMNAHFLSDRYLEKGDYLRLSTLTLAYDFKNIGSWIKNIRLYATCNNVFVLTGYKGLDPEIYLGGLTPGIDNRQTYPRTRTFMFGINVNF